MKCVDTFPTMNESFRAGKYPPGGPGLAVLFSALNAEPGNPIGMVKPGLLLQPWLTSKSQSLFTHPFHCMKIEFEALHGDPSKTVNAI